jgi:hypothetical protein
MLSSMERDDSGAAVNVEMHGNCRYRRASIRTG